MKLALHLRHGVTAREREARPDYSARLRVVVGVRVR
jgi:hypothetical protein